MCVCVCVLVCVYEQLTGMDTNAYVNAQVTVMDNMFTGSNLNPKPLNPQT